MPERIVPMLARLTQMPARDEGWAWEVKWDGVRAIAYARPGRLRLESRNLNEITAQYPEVRGLRGALGAREAVLDGELVAFDPEGRPSFERLQQRMHLTSESVIRRRMKSQPVAYMVFDLLYLDGRTLMQEPYTERRELLEQLELEGEHWSTPGYSVGNGRALLDATRERGLEGLIGKRLDSRYEPGRRPGTWIKVKNTAGQELVIGGWLPGKGRRRDRIGALLVGYYDDGELRYAGKVGTGFSDDDLVRLAERLRPLERDSSPFSGRQPERGAIFVEPELVAEIVFTEWTRSGTLRHPSFKGLREDKSPREVTRERPG
jgi:bifunctional non-homologous end joining protein LigD